MRVITSWASTTAPAAPADRSNRALWSATTGGGVKRSREQPSHSTRHTARCDRRLTPSLPDQCTSPTMELEGRGASPWTRTSSWHITSSARPPSLVPAPFASSDRPRHAVTAGPREHGQKPGFLSRSGRSHTTPPGYYRTPPRTAPKRVRITGPQPSPQNPCPAKRDLPQSPTFTHTHASRPLFSALRCS